MKPLKSFVNQRILLLGTQRMQRRLIWVKVLDKAMEDAIVLVNCLAEYDIEKALKRYDKLRVKHTAKVIKRSRKIGKIAQKTTN